MCRHRPTEVVIWKVVFPKGMEVKGTSVEETSPRVYDYSRSYYESYRFKRYNTISHTLYGANILDARGGTEFSKAPNLRRFNTGPSSLSIEADGIIGCQLLNSTLECKRLHNSSMREATAHNFFSNSSARFRFYFKTHIRPPIKSALTSGHPQQPPTSMTLSALELSAWTT